MEKELENSGIKNKLLLIAGGIVCGFANGFFGGGGGMIVVPFLVYIMKIEAKKAHATAIAVILPVTIFSAITYLITFDISVKLLIPVTIGVFIGGVLGAYLLPKLQNKAIMFIFAGIMIVAGVKLILG